ncbi:hypothetical protein TNCV_2028311 [Trichonephila clavipes]|nr:hypothetical protein TNCV_2028311 [Trichonephila clavipes]
MATPRSSFTPTPLGHEDNLGVRRMSPTAVRRDLNDAGVSVSSKIIRSRLADVRLKGRILGKKSYLNLQQR